MLHGLPPLFPPRARAQVIPRRRRVVIELHTEEEGRVLHIVENGVAPVSVRAYAETPALTGGGNTFACGASGPWTLTPAAWRLTGKASIGDLIEWSPNVLLQGGPAVFDLGSLVNNSARRWKSSGVNVPSPLGSMYTQGDYGTARLPVLHWRVAANDIADDGTVTLVLGYRAGGDMTLGHVSGVSRVSLANFGPVDGGAAEPFDSDVSGTRVWLGMGDPDVVPENYHEVDNIAIDTDTLDIYELP